MLSIDHINVFLESVTLSVFNAETNGFTDLY